MKGFSKALIAKFIQLSELQSTNIMFNKILHVKYMYETLPRGYKILSWSARENLRNECEASMTEAEVNRRVRRIFRCILKEVCSNKI